MKKMNFLLSFLMVLAMLPLFSQTSLSSNTDSKSFDSRIVRYGDNTYCDASTGTRDEYIANVLFGSINKSSYWQSGVANYIQSTNYILSDHSDTITITNGDPMAADSVKCWVDWNMNSEFDLDPALHEVFPIENVGGIGETFVGLITVPENTPDGFYRLRVRMTYNTQPYPCGESSYGEVEDYTIRVGDSLANDVGLVSFDMGAFYQPGIITPKATVKNFGLSTQDFDVVLNIGSYSATKTVSALATGNVEQITFDNWSASPGSYAAEVCTQLSGDEYAVNDCQAKEINIASGNYAFGFNYADGRDSIVRFDISNPASLFNFAPIESSDLIAAACLVDYSLYALARDGSLYSVDYETGVMTFIANTSASQGLAYDGNRVYGCSYTQLFEIDPETGQEVLIGDLGINDLMVGIACDMYGTLYGVGGYIASIYSISKIAGTATLIENLSIDFSGLLNLSFDKENNICYVSSNKPDIEEGLYTVDVFTGATAHYYSYPNNIRIYGVAIPYTTSPPAGPAPEGFMANYDEDAGVQCAWGNPPPEQWIGYDSGENNDGLGSDGGGTFWGAIRFEPEDLIAYDNSMITKVAFFPRKFATASEMTLMIWEGSEAANLIYEQTMTGLVWNEWNEVELNLGYYIDATTELWIGFKVVHPANEYPLGYDFGPAVAGYGDLVSFDGMSWESLSFYGLDFNYNLKALVVENEKVSLLQKSAIQKIPLSNPGGKMIAGNLKPSAVPAFVNPSKSLLGINVYRDNVKVNPDLIPLTTQEYLDDFHTPGTYTYTAKAVYEDGLSDHSNPATVTIPGANIAVEPESIEETHDNPPQITTRTLTISNIGDIPLDWAITYFKNSDQLSLANDVGVSIINAPASSMIYTDAEPVIFTIKNFGDASQTNIPWELSWEGPADGEIISGIFTGNLSSGEIVEIVADTIDMTSAGDYLFEACTQLDGDELTDNDCKTKMIFGPMVYCDASTTNEDEYIAHVSCGNIDNASGWQGGVADYTAISTYIDPGDSEEIIVSNGNPWASDRVTVWVDWNRDLIFDLGGDEEFVLTSDGIGEIFTGEITVPSDTPWGDYRMRIRMTYSVNPDPCGSSSYGEVEDYTIKCDFATNEWLSFDPTIGSVPAGETTEVELSFDSDGLSGGTYYTDILIESNSTEFPVLEVPVTFDVIIAPPIINVDPNEFEFYLDYFEVETQEMDISNEGVDDLMLDISITYYPDAFGSATRQLIEYENVISPDQLGLANTGNPTPSPNITYDEVIRYDDGINQDAIGLSAGGTFQVSAYWPASVMGQYAGMELTSIEIYINDVPTSCVMKICGQGSATVPGALLHLQTMTVSAQAWNTIELSSPVVITGNDIWIGYEITQLQGIYTPGCDFGPAVAGYGDMISLDGITYEPMSYLGLDYNWNIAATLSGETQVEWLSVSPMSASIDGGAMVTFDVTADAAVFGGPLEDLYYATIWIASNDPFTPVVQVPVVIIPDPDGINDVNDDAYLLIFPNPVGNRVNISSNYSMSNYKLLNHQGQMVMKGDVNGKKLSIDTSQLEAGIYFVAIYSEAGESTHKLIVE